MWGKAWAAHVVRAMALADLDHDVHSDQGTARVYVPDSPSIGAALVLRGHLERSSWSWGGVYHGRMVVAHVNSWSVTVKVEDYPGFTGGGIAVAKSHGVWASAFWKSGDRAHAEQARRLARALWAASRLLRAGRL